MLAKKLLNENIQAAITKEIAEAEQRTSGEICIHAEDFCAGDPYKRAVQVFTELGLHRTELRNAVLLYLAIHDRKLAIIGDQGVNEWIGAEGWAVLTEDLLQHFAKSQYEAGLVKTIHAIADKLAEHFPPPDHSDRNELPNHISFGA
jgi:uncharacterized membrane protein